MTIEETIYNTMLTYADYSDRVKMTRQRETEARRGANERMFGDVMRGKAMSVVRLVERLGEHFAGALTIKREESRLH